jgi:hypothetical protein
MVGLSLAALVRAKYFDGGDERFSDRRPADNCSTEYSASPANRVRYFLLK